MKDSRDIIRVTCSRDVILVEGSRDVIRVTWWKVVELLGRFVLICFDGGLV